MRVLYLLSIYCLILFIAGCSAVLKQDPDNQPSTQNYIITQMTEKSPTGSIKGYYKYEYDAQYFLVKMVWYDSCMVTNSITEYQYNEYNQIKKIIEKDEMGALTGFYESVYQYNSFGQIVKKIETGDDGDIDTFEYLYNINNQLCTENQSCNGDPCEIYTTIYNSEGKQIRRNWTDVDDSPNPSTGYWEYEYNSEGYCIKQISYSRDELAYYYDATQEPSLQKMKEPIIPQVESMIVSPNELIAQSGHSYPLTCNVYEQFHGKLPCEIKWQVHGAIGTINQDAFLASQAGTGYITAALDELVTTIAVTVTTNQIEELRAKSKNAIRPSNEPARINKTNNLINNTPIFFKNLSLRVRKK